MPVAVRAFNGVNWDTTPTAIRCFDGADWDLHVQRVYAWSGSAWTEIWVRSDPVVVSFNPTDSASYRPSAWRATADGIRQGSWDFGDHIGCMAFDYAAIQAAIGTRTVSAARIYMSREAGGFGAARSPTFWSLQPAEVNTSKLLVKSGQPDLYNGSNYKTPSSLATGASGWLTLQAAHGQRIVDGTARGIAMALSETLAYPGGQDSDYMVFSEHTAATITLELTADYV